MKSAIYVVLAVVFLSFTGCASILTDKTTKVNVTTSNNKPATVTANNGATYQVPAILSIRKANDDLVLKASGECEGQAFSAAKIEPTFWINILVPGGPFGSSTDYGTDKMWKYEDNMEIRCK